MSYVRRVVLIVSVACSVALPAGHVLAGPGVAAPVTRVAQSSAQPPSGAADPSSTVTLSAEATGRLAPLLLAAGEFRMSASVDYLRALDRFASPGATASVRAIDPYLWLATPSRAGWSYLLALSTTVVAGADSPTPLVAFYHPWADVFVVTAWRLDRETPQIVDVDVVLGDWLRRSGRAPIDGEPLWRSGDWPMPFALGEATARSVRAFEQTFADWQIGDWRARIGLAAQAPRVEGNYPAAAAALYVAMRNAQAFAIASPGEPALLDDVRVETARAVHALRQGRADDVLRIARGTPAPTATLVRSMGADGFDAMIVVGTYLEGDDRAIVLLAPEAGGGYFVSFMFHRAGDAIALGRIDVVEYAAFYRRVAQGGAAGATDRGGK